MSFNRIAVLGVLAFAAAASAQSPPRGENNCIVAGRLSDEARWAPRFSSVQLLGQDGRAVTSSDKQALSAVRQVRLSAPALLSRCDGEGQLAIGPDVPGTKAPVPALRAGVVPVEAVSFPKLRRGGELVELKLTVPADRVTLLTR